MSEEGRGFFITLFYLTKINETYKYIYIYKDKINNKKKKVCGAIYIKKEWRKRYTSEEN